MAANEEGSRNKIKEGGIWSPVSITPGCGRVANLGLLCKTETWNAVRAPNPIPHHRRGRGFSALLHNHPNNPSGAIGMGRARSRDSGPCPLPDPPL